MNLETKRSAYREFFQKSPAGAEFMAALENIIAANHQKAENDPDHARDFTQRACGVREVLNHITGVTTEVKKGRTPRE